MIGEGLKTPIHLTSSNLFLYGVGFFLFLGYCGEISKIVVRKCNSNSLVAFDSNTIMHEKVSRDTAKISEGTSSFQR